MKPNKPFISESIALLMLLTSIFIYSCRKEILQNKTTEPTEVNLSKVKAWYQSKYPISGKQTNDLTAGNRDISQIIQPDWEAADVYRRGDDDVIELPAETDDYLIGLNNSDGKSYNPKYSHSSFVLLKKGEEVIAYVMTVVADSSYINGDMTKLQKNKYNQRDEHFSGLVIYSTPKGEFVSGWILQNGIILQKLEKRIAPTGQSNTRGKQNLDLKVNRVQMIEVCTAWYQWSYDENGNVVDYHYLDTICHTYYVDDGGGNGSVGTVPGEGGGGSGSGSGSTPSPNPSPCTPTPVASVKSGGGLKINLVQPPDGGFPPPTDPGPCIKKQEIKNQIKNDCLRGAVNEALSKGASTFSTSIANHLFGINSERDVLLQEDSNMAANLDAETYANNSYEFIITYNSNLSTASKEYVAVTTMHEIIHDMMDIYGKANELKQHNSMANNYVSIMANDLRIMFPSISIADATALAWGGLGETTAWKQMVQNDPTKANQIIQTNKDYKNATGTKGSRCVTPSN